MLHILFSFDFFGGEDIWSISFIEMQSILRYTLVCSVSSWMRGVCSKKEERC